MATLTNIGDFALFKQTEPYLYVTQIRDFSVELSGTTSVSEFRWSIDNITYSAWIELSMDQLRNVSIDPANELWLEFRTILISDGPVTVDNFQVQLETQPWDKYAGYTPPSIDCTESGNITSITTLQDLCFNPYDVNPAVCLFNELSYIVNQLFGHQVEYYRAVPDKRSQDITLQEYTLYNVEVAKCIKVLVPNNEFPDDKLSFNPFGIDFEVPFEVEIDKQYWEGVFGEGTGPQKRDILYFALNNRIYEIASSYLFSAFMEKPSYWKISLVKYHPKSNRYEPDSVRQTIEDLTVSASELFGEDVQGEADKLTKPQQFNKFIGNNKYDPSRLEIHKNIVVKETSLTNYSTVISEFQYKLNTLVNYDNLIQDSIVIYRQPMNFTKETELAYSCWIKNIKPAFFSPIDGIDLMALNTLTNQLSMSLTKARSYVVGDVIKIFRGNTIVLYGTIITVTSLTDYTLQLNDDVVTYLDIYNLSWSGLSNYKAQKIVLNNLIDGYDAINQLGIRIDLIANRYISVLQNANEYIFPITTSLTDDKWYGIFINMSNRFRQVSTYIWERKWVEDIPSSPRTTELYNIYNKTINSIIPEDRIAEKNLQVLASNSELTNIRLFTETSEIEKQSNILNQNIVIDSQNALIIDNALPHLKLPFIAQSK